MAEVKSTDDSQLHWFWKYTTKWWFFPVYYVVLVFLLSFLYMLDKKEILALLGFAYILISMPIGLLYLANIPKEGTYQVLSEWDGSYIFILLFIVLFSIITYYKYKKETILKWLIITLFLLITLSFVGCAGIILSGSSVGI